MLAMLTISILALDPISNQPYLCIKLELLFFLLFLF